MGADALQLSDCMQRYTNAGERIGARIGPASHGGRKTEC
jgi:hypothetical protein